MNRFRRPDFANRIARPLTDLGTLICFLLLLLASGAFAVAIGSSTLQVPLLMLAPLVLLACAVGVALLIVPLHWLPSFAFFAFAFLPRELFIGVPYVDNLGPAIIVMLVLVVRHLLEPGAGRPRQDAVVVIGLLFLGWCSISMLASDLNTLNWVASIALTVVAPIVLVTDARAITLLKYTMLVAGAAVGAYASFQQIVQRNPLFDGIYANAGGVGQHWAVFRSEATLGHPLYAATLLAVCSSLGIGEWLQSGQRIPLILGLASGAGLVATVSRGPMLAVVIASAVVVIMLLKLSTRGLAVRAFGLLSVGAVLLVSVSQLGSVSERNSSAEAASSTSARLAIISIARDIAGPYQPVGSGPGTSSALARDATTLVVENSWLQLMISVGYVGMIIFMLLVAVCLVRSGTRGDLAATAAMVTYLVCISNYNAIDDVRSMHILLGTLVVLCLGQNRNSPSARPATLSKRLLNDRIRAAQVGLPAGDSRERRLMA